MWDALIVAEMEDSRVNKNCCYYLDGASPKKAYQLSKKS